MSPVCTECGGTPHWCVRFLNAEPGGERYGCDWHLLRAVELMSQESGEVVVTEIRP